MDSFRHDRLPFLHEGHERQRQAPACWPATLQPRWGAPGEDQALRDGAEGQARAPGHGVPDPGGAPHDARDSPRPSRGRSTRHASPSVAGSRLTVPLVDGRQVQYANLDHGASAPCLDAVQDAVNELLPWYASVHRGAGFASQVSTKVYERARRVVRDFVGARRTDEVVFTRNTTDALNLLARALPQGHVGDRVRHRPPRRAAAVARPERAPRDPDRQRRARPRRGTGRRPRPGRGSSWSPAPRTSPASCGPSPGSPPSPAATAPAIVLDAAQLAPHRPVDARALDVDYVVLSGHKLYAPFGAGALVGRADWLRAAYPYLAGGGATKQVSAWRPARGVLELRSGTARGRLAQRGRRARARRRLRDADPALGRDRRARGGAARPAAHRARRASRACASSSSSATTRRASASSASSSRATTRVSSPRTCRPSTASACGTARSARTSPPRGWPAGGRCGRASVSAAPPSTSTACSARCAGWSRTVRRGEYELVDGRWAPVADPRPLPAFLAAP